jgi:D-3-phosphoglycerate dehydrogenase
MMLTALYFENLSYTTENCDLLAHAFRVIRLPDPRHVTCELLAKIDVIFAPLGYRFDEDFFLKCPRLKVIATNTTGVPHINVEVATRQGISVVSLKNDFEFLQSITPTAELTLGLIIAITRNLVPACDAVKKGNWCRWDFGGTAMLSRMSLGVIGLGRLGEKVARYAACMGMKVNYCDPFRNDLPEEANSYRRCKSLEDLVQSSDVVTLHVPMEDRNRQMLRHFKEGSYLVNTARGELVDNLALVAALESGQLAGAAVDVLDGEFDPDFVLGASRHPLICYANKSNNLIITPHIGGSTKDAWSLTQRRTIEKAKVAAYSQNTDS